MAKRKTSPRRSQSFKVGDRVELLQYKHLSWGDRKPQRYGYVTRIDGAYHYVRPRWWKASEVFEFYPGEIKHAPLQ